MKEQTFATALLAGSAAGLCVDLTLYPLDTIKTRLQSSEGLLKSGGLRGVYRGVGSVAVGSMPGAAVFFASYETMKTVTRDVTAEKYIPLTHMAAASTGEMTACVVRVPVEVVKQRAMVSKHLSSLQVLSATLRQEGMLGLYRGYFSTVMREIPFSLIQFPLWESFKRQWSEKQGRAVDTWQSAVCGAGAGGIAACVTTPLDVAKTRIMLAKHGTEIARGSVIFAMQYVFKERGARGLFAGVVPRTLWISLGGAIFLGVYDKTKAVYSSLFDFMSR